MTLDEFLRQFGSGLDQGFSLLGLGVVFLAGIVASAVCPCTLPVGLGMAGAAGASEAESRRSGWKIAAAMIGSAVTGFTRLGSWRRTIEFVSGCALFFVSIYYARVFLALA